MKEICYVKIQYLIFQSKDECESSTAYLSSGEAVSGNGCANNLDFSKESNSLWRDCFLFSTWIKAFNPSHRTSPFFSWRIGWKLESRSIERILLFINVCIRLEIRKWYRQCEYVMFKKRTNKKSKQKLWEFYWSRNQPSFWLLGII